MSETLRSSTAADPPRRDSSRVRVCLRDARPGPDVRIGTAYQGKSPRITGAGSGGKSGYE